MRRPPVLTGRILCGAVRARYPAAHFRQQPALGNVALPNFLIIGAAKSGTTSLYEYLRQHPDIYMSPMKEPGYYRDGGAVRTREAYERLFDGVTSQKAIGEASPQYLNSATAPGRIAASLPGVRLIASLRNPADRAYSSYLGRLRGGSERCGVDEAMRPDTYYFNTSLYHPRLSRYFAHFDRSRVRVIIFDDFVANPGAVVRDLHQFLEVDDAFTTDVTVRHNAAHVPRSLVLNEALCALRPVVRNMLPSAMRGVGLFARAQRLVLRPPEPLPSSIRRRLLQQFSDDIARTAMLIGRDLSHWLE